MKIEGLYNEKEIEVIKNKIEFYIKEYQDNKLPKNIWHYFHEIADDTQLPKKVYDLLKKIEIQEIKIEEIPDMLEISQLFKVNRTSVMKYLRLRLSQSEYLIYQKICYANARKKAMTTLINKGKRHILSREEQSKGGRN